MKKPASKESKFLEKPVRNLPKDLPTMNDRIEYIRCTLGYPVSTFAIKIGSSKSSMKKVLEGDVTPHMKMILNILEIFPISQEWLYLGTGQPFKVNDLSEHIFEKVSSKHQDDVDMGVNERVREIRMDTGMSQPVFASTLGVTKDIIAFIETGRTAISVPTMKKLLQKYNISDQWMLWGIGNKYRVKK